MVRMKSQFCVFLFCLVQITISANYDFITDRVECITTPKDLCQKAYCTSRPIKRYITYIDAGCSLLEEVDNIMVRVTLYYKFTEYRQFLIDLEESVCDYLNNKKPTKLVEMFIPPLLNASNIKSCPLKGDIIVKDLNMNDVKDKPAGLPAGQYRVDIRVTSEKRPFIFVKIYMTAKPKGIAQLEMG